MTGLRLNKTVPDDLELSVITTAHNEAGNVIPFLDGAMQAIRELRINAEIVYIDDASKDNTAQAVRRFVDEHPEAKIRLIVHETCRGITAAIAESIALAKGNYVCYLPSDLESLPQEDIPKLYRALDENTDAVVGWRNGRDDGKMLASRVYNLLNRALFGVDLRDANWIKLVRRERLEGIELRSDWHRFLIPILAHNGCRLKEVETQWHRRSYGRSKFGLARLPGALGDLLGVKLYLSFRRRPLTFFSWTAFYCFLLSLAGLLAGLLAAPGGLGTAFLVLFGAGFVGGMASMLVGAAVEFLKTQES